MTYTLTFVLKYRCHGKVKTIKTLLYSGNCYSELLTIQDRNTVAGLHSVTVVREKQQLDVFIVENNVD